MESHPFFLTSKCCEDSDSLGSVGDKNFGAFVSGGSCGEYVINENDGFV